MYRRISPSLIMIRCSPHVTVPRGDSRRGRTVRRRRRRAGGGAITGSRFVSYLACRKCLPHTRHPAQSILVTSDFIGRNYCTFHFTFLLSQSPHHVELHNIWKYHRNCLVASVIAGVDDCKPCHSIAHAPAFDMSAAMDEASKDAQYRYTGLLFDCQVYDLLSSVL